MTVYYRNDELFDGLDEQFMADLWVERSCDRCGTDICIPRNEFQPWTCYYCERCERVRQNGRESYQRGRKRQSWAQPQPGDWGVEVEADYNDPDEAAADCGRNWSGETDGSLNGATGMEVVSAPMRLETLKAETSAQFATLFGEHGGQNSSRSYGVHVSVHGGAFDIRTRWKAIHFTNRSNLALTRWMAGREEAHFAPFTSRGISLRRFTYHRTDKYKAVSYRDYGALGRIEWRMFRTSCAMNRDGVPVGILAALESVESLLELAGNRHIGVRTSGADFVRAWFATCYGERFANARRMVLIRCLNNGGSTARAILSLAGTALIDDAKRARDEWKNDGRIQMSHPGHFG